MATSPYGSDMISASGGDGNPQQAANYNMASDTPTSAGDPNRKRRRPQGQQGQPQDQTQGDAGTAQRQTFAQMQQAGQARPSPAVLQQQGAQSLQGMAQQLLQNPSAYNDQAMQAQFARMSGQIDDQYKQKEVATREEMARRGLSDSSIAGGRLADLNVGKRSAQTELAAQIAEQAANRYTSDRVAAMNAALGVNAQDIQQNQFGQQMGLNYAQLAQSGNQFDRSLSQSGSQFDRNLAQQGNQFQQNLGFNQFQAQQQNNQFLQNLAQQGYQFDRNLGQQQNQFQQNYGLQRDQFNANQNQFQQNFGEDQRRYNQNFGEQGRQFDANLANNRYQFDNTLQQNGLQYLMSMLGPNFATWGNAPSAYGGQNAPNAQSVAYGRDTMPTLSYGG